MVALQHYVCVNQKNDYRGGDSRRDVGPFCTILLRATDPTTAFICDTAYKQKRSNQSEVTLCNDSLESIGLTTTAPHGGSRYGRRTRVEHGLDLPTMRSSLQHAS